VNADSDAIGIFDSGVGGLTVFRSIAERLAGESIVYLGDTARVPYGTRSAETVIRYAQSCTAVLLDRRIKLLVVACNTASAVALDVLRDALDIPVLGVIEPGSHAAVNTSRNGRIGVIGTAATIRSGEYTRIIKALAPNAQIVAKACPLFVPLAEEGWTDGPVPLQVANAYLEDILAQHVDTLVLGCTHYPLLAPIIAKTAGEAVTLVDSAEATARAVQLTLAAMDLCANSDAPRREFIVTDAPAAFAQMGRRFLGYDVGDVEWVDI
jgi:glutamate racemase